MFIYAIEWWDQMQWKKIPLSLSSNCIQSKGFCNYWAHIALESYICRKNTKVVFCRSFQRSWIYPIWSAGGSRTSNPEAERNYSRWSYWTNHSQVCKLAEFQQEWSSTYTTDIGPIPSTNSQVSRPNSSSI